MNKLLTAGVVLALVLGAVGVFFPQTTTVVRELVGRGDDFPQAFNSGIWFAGKFDPDTSVPTLEAADDIASTLTASSSQICSNNVLKVSFSTATGTITLPSALQLSQNGTCLAKIGSSHTFFLWSANDVANGTTTFEKSASSSLDFPILNNTATASTTMLGSSTARVDGLRVSSGSQEWVLWNVTNY